MTDSACRRVLGALLTAYLPALRSYLLVRHRLRPDRADDLLHGFVADKVVAQDLVRRADRERGRFRTFLMASLDRFVVDQIRHEQAAKRSPAGGVSSLAASQAAEHPASAAPDLFDVAWARQVLEMAVVRMREECEAGRRSDVWAVFQGRVLEPTLGQGEPVPIGRIAGEFGLSPEQAFSLLKTARRMFARHLRALVTEYAEEEEVEDEIRWLKTALSRSGA